MQEEWKDVPGYEGYYQASMLGRIRSLDRVVKHGGHDMFIKGRVMLLTRSRGKNKRSIPYYRVALRRNGKARFYFVHRLVAVTWIGPCPPGFETRHGPGGFADNSVGNLCYGLRSDNEKDKVRDKTVYNVCVQRSDGVRFNSVKEAAKKTDCWSTHICAVCTGRRGSTGGYGWSYI